MKSKAAIWIVLGLVSGWSAMAANVYVVPPGTPGAAPSAPYTSWATAATNIADAITAIVTNDGNIVFISNGTYMLPDQITVNKGVILRSWKDGQTDRDGTILDGNNYPGKPVTNRVITLNHPEAVLDGLTIQGGGPIQVSTPRDPRGAGVFIYRFAMITNCLIANNISAVLTNANSQGGGICVDALYTNLGVITHCLIVSNQASQGGGIYATPTGNLLVEHCQILTNQAINSGSTYGGGGVLLESRSLNGVATFRNCLIAYNAAPREGAGVVMWYAGLFENCQIVSNDASPGGVAAGVYIYNSSKQFYYGMPYLRNCLFQGNSVGTGTRAAVGIEIGADIPNKEVAALIENCTIVDNPTGWGWRHVNTTATSAVHFVNTIIYGHDTDVVGLANRTYFTNCLSSVALPGDNNITNVAPTFVDGYHLAGDSAGVNAGLNQAWMTEPGAKDLDGQTRVDRFSGKVDMGCYEHIPRGTAFLLR